MPEDKTTLQKLKESHSPHMSDGDFIKMLAAANDITLAQDVDGRLRVASDEEKAAGYPDLITPEQTNQTPLGSWAVQHLTEQSNIRGIAHDTLDALGAAAKAPFSLWDKGVGAAEDIANAGMRWFDDDADELSFGAIKSGVSAPSTTLGRIIGTASEIALATAATGGAGGLASAVSQGAAKAGLTRASAQAAGSFLSAGPQTATALQTAGNALRNAAIDFIAANPDDKNIAAELQEVIDKPWLAALATQPQDSRIVRRYKHMTDGFVIGELAFPAIGKLARTAGKAAEAIAERLPKRTPKPPTAAQRAYDAAMDDFAETIPPYDAMRGMKEQLAAAGLPPDAAARTANVIEAWAVTVKGGDEPLDDFLAARSITFTRAKTPKGKKGFVDLPAIGAQFSKESPANITITLGVEADESTILHELGHIFLHDKLDREVKGLLKEGEAAELRTIKGLIGWRVGQPQVTVQQQEKFAKAFEQWFLTGTAPKGSEATFSAFQKQMRDIYEDSLATGAELPQAYNSIFGRMLGNADTDPERLRLYQLGANPEKEAEAIVKNSGGGQAAYGYTVNPARLSGADRALHMKHLTGELMKQSPVPDEITRVRHNWETDREAREMLSTFGKDIREQVKKAAEQSKTWNATIRACEYMIYQSAEQLAPLYQQLDDITDESARILVKGKIYSQLREQAFYRNANAQLTATAARILESKKHGLTEIDFDTELRRGADVVFNAASTLPEIPKAALDAGDAAAVKRAIDEIGADEVDFLVQAGKRHTDALENASAAFDYLTWGWRKKLGDSAKELFYANLLSNPGTWAVNTLTNGVKALVTPTEWMIEGAARYGIGKTAAILGVEDFARRVNLDTDYGAQTFRFGLNLYNSYHVFLKDALEIAVNAYKSGRPVVKEAVGFVEDYRPARMLSTEAWGMNGATLGGWLLDALGQAVSIPGRVLMATDQLFKVLAGRGGTYAEIMEDALAQGIKQSEMPEFIETEMTKRISRKIVNGQLASETYLSPAVQQLVKEQTFTQDAGKITQTMMKLRSSVPGAYTIFPFLQSPVNIVKDTAMHTPAISALYAAKVGINNLASLALRNQEIARRGGAARSKLLGQLAIAQGIWCLAEYLVEEGKITGSGPRNPSAKKTKENLGWQEYSVLIGDKWVKYSAADPFGTILGIAADYHMATQQADDSEKDAQFIQDLAGAMTMALANNLGNKTYLMNLGQVLNIINSPDKKVQSLLNMGTDAAMNFVMPRVFTNIARDVGISDPYMKEVRSCLDKLIARIPGLSDELPTQYSWLTGEPREYSPYSSLNRFYMKENSSTVPDKLRAELLQLDQVLSGPPDRVNNNQLTSEQYSRFCVLNATTTIAGRTLLEALDDVIRTSRYENGDSDERAKILRSTIGHYRSKAKIQLIEEFPELAKKRQTAGNDSASNDLEALVKYGQS